ncbi:MAG TPA: zinc-dependent metalloprotease [Verrucomicrobiae bacterium]|nr:zinc-dependent metalloprotease [Verrucomicrobiae bacterium]
MTSLLAPAGFDFAADKPGDSAKSEDSKDSKDGDKKADDKKSKIKKYDEVITTNAVTKVGLFRVHRVDDKLYYEIPVEALNTDLLWVVQISETTEGSSYAGMPVVDRIVRWELRDDEVLLRDVHYDIRADTSDPIAQAVKASNLAPIIRAFEVKAYGKDKAPVIDVTDLFKKDVPEISARRALHCGAMDDQRSFIDEFKAFPRNVNVRVLATFAPGKEKGGGSDDGPQSSGITAVLCHSMVKLPEDLMKPRRFDSRVGFFTEAFTDYTDREEPEAETIQYILRWRLEKKNPDAKVSEPVKPIVFYVAREVPEKWKRYVKEGIEDWEPAFEGAGFTNAIFGKYAPDPNEDPDWDVEDARISSIRWLPSDIENAFGPQVHDPRTGEILSADVRIYHNVQKLVRDWYFVQASPNDPRAQHLPLPDDLEGELIRFVVAHEVGHSLGFPHNMKASSSYSIEQLRNPEWTKKNGTAPSVMDYARYNYVAQPGDGAGLLPKVGPYDYFALNWGYRQFPKGADEKAELEELVKVQIDQPMFRFGGPNADVDSTQQTEDLSSNAVEATRLGLLNLERVAGYLVKATSKPGKDYELLSDEYDSLLGQWSREMGHVANVVGGVEEINLYYGDATRRYFPNSAAYEQKAVNFLIDNALTRPAIFLGDDVVSRLTAEGTAQRVLNAQSGVLRNLISSQRIDRLAEIEQTSTNATYGPAKLFADLRGGIFHELTGNPVSIDLYRRNLQRAYIDMLASNLKNPAANSDLPAYSRAELEAIRASIRKTDGVRIEPVSEIHLKDLTARISRALDPRLPIEQ